MRKRDTQSPCAEHRLEDLVATLPDAGLVLFVETELTYQEAATAGRVHPIRRGKPETPVGS